MPLLSVAFASANFELLARATKINKLIRLYGYDFKSAQALLVKGGRAWCLQGTQFVDDHKYPAEIFLRITSFVLGMPDQDAKNFGLQSIKVFLT